MAASSISDKYHHCNLKRKKSIISIIHSSTWWQLVALLTPRSRPRCSPFAQDLHMMMVVVVVVVVVAVEMVMMVAIRGFVGMIADGVPHRTDGIGHSVIHDCIHAHRHTVLRQNLGDKAFNYDVI